MIESYYMLDWTLIAAEFKLVRLIPFFVVQENTFLPFVVLVLVGVDDCMLDRIRYGTTRVGYA
jgi:hypothetical protein